MPVAFTPRIAVAPSGDGILGKLSAGLYSPTGKVTTLGKLGKP
jgi:hypothetical protein